MTDTEFAEVDVQRDGNEGVWVGDLHLYQYESQNPLTCDLCGLGTEWDHPEGDDYGLAWDCIRNLYTDPDCVLTVCSDCVAKRLGD